jgi:hypothetical protein
MDILFGASGSNGQQTSFTICATMYYSSGGEGQYFASSGTRPWKDLSSQASKN